MTPCPKPAVTMIHGPVWKHNCTECRFLGHIHGYDLYFCRFENLPVATARYNDAADGILRDHIDNDHWNVNLKRAAELARAQGLYP